MSQRTDRLDSQIRARSSPALLQREMQDPRLGFATITRVETARDLVRPGSGSASWAPTRSASSHDGADPTPRPGCAAGSASRLSIRKVPELSLRDDDSIEAANRVLRLLRDLQDEAAPVSRAAIFDGHPRARRVSPPSATRTLTPTRSAPRLRCAWRPSGSASGPRSSRADAVPPSLVDLPGAADVRRSAGARARPRDRRGRAAVAHRRGRHRLRRRLARARIANVDHHISQRRRGRRSDVD